MQVHTFESDAEHENAHKPRRLFEDIAKSGKSTKHGRSPSGAPSATARVGPPIGKKKNRIPPSRDAASVKLGPSPLSQFFIPDSAGATSSPGTTLSTTAQSTANVEKTPGEKETAAEGATTVVAGTSATSSSASDVVIAASLNTSPTATDAKSDPISDVVAPSTSCAVDDPSATSAPSALSVGEIDAAKEGLGGDADATKSVTAIVTTDSTNDVGATPPAAMVEVTELASVDVGPTASSPEHADGASYAPATPLAAASNVAKEPATPFTPLAKNTRVVNKLGAGWAPFTPPSTAFSTPNLTPLPKNAGAANTLGASFNALTPPPTAFSTPLSKLVGSATAPFISSPAMAGLANQLNRDATPLTTSTAASAAQGQTLVDRKSVV